MVKNERNKAHAQIIEMKEIKEQLTEKTKIVANEMEILRTIAGEKEKSVVIVIYITGNSG